MFPGFIYHHSTLVNLLYLCHIWCYFDIQTVSLAMGCMMLICGFAVFLVACIQSVILGKPVCSSQQMVSGTISDTYWKWSHMIHNILNVQYGTCLTLCTKHQCSELPLFKCLRKFSHLHLHMAICICDKNLTSQSLPFHHIFSIHYFKYVCLIISISWKNSQSIIIYHNISSIKQLCSSK